MSLLKAEAARRQLGTALALHLRDQDPFSVHVLASGGAELAEGLVEEAGRRPMRDFALASRPNITRKMYYEQKKQYVNAMKHYRNLEGQVRDDEKTLSEFTELNNDAYLWDGWSNPGFSGHPIPIEAHIFIAWFLAQRPESFPDDDDAQSLLRSLNREFPGVRRRSRTAQKDLLKRAIRRAASNPVFMCDEKTDRRPLILP